MKYSESPFCASKPSPLRWKILWLFLLIAGVTPAVQAQPDYPLAIWNQAYTNHWYTGGNSHSFCVIHDMEGYYEAVISYFQMPTQGGSNSYASVYYCVNSLQNGNDSAHSHVEGNTVDAPAGEITQMVREKYWAWHVICWNTYMFGTEHEGFVNSPAWYSEAMYQSSAALQRYLCTKYAIPMDRNHIIGHNEWQNSTWTNWMAANWPQIDTTCNNHTDPGQYWNWTHFMQLMTGSTNVAPGLGNLLRNHATDQGSNITYYAAANGTNVLAYQWYFNGAPIAGATGSAYTLSNLQTSNAGAYSVIVTNLYGSITSAVSTLSVNPSQNWITVFSDNFDTDSSTNWKLFQASSDGVSDYTTNWAFDYSTNTYTFNGVTQTIPVAPSTTNGTRRGLKITVNKNDTDAADSGVSLYPLNLNLSGNYALRFDMWINYPGGVAGAGSTGSTEYATCGINHTGTEINWGAGTASASDGLWFAVDGEGGATTDYLAYSGKSNGNPTLHSIGAGGFSAAGALTTDNSDMLFVNIFPNGPYETPGAPGKHWVQGEVSQINNMITWKLNNVIVAVRTNLTSYTNGDIMIGYMDIIPSIANPAQDSYVIFDNVRVLVSGMGPVITSQPQDFGTVQGSGTNATFTVQATGSPAPVYQWQFNGTNIAAATGSSYTVTNPQPTNVGAYAVLVSNVVSSMLSSNAMLSLFTAPAITTQPKNHTVNQGSSISLFVVTTGSPAPAYQWQQNGTNVAGATNSIYLLTNIQTNQAGNYQVYITNNFGVTNSIVVTQTVNFAPIITGQPQSQSVTAGSNAIFTVTAAGSPVPGYQWLFNGGPIAGATANSYTLFSVRTTNAGSYSVTVTNSLNSSNSSSAVLSVMVASPQIQRITLTNGNVQITVMGEPGGTYAVDSSSNLVNWATLGTFLNTNGVAQFSDTPTNNAQGFYRVRWISD